MFIVRLSSQGDFHVVYVHI